MCHPEGNRQARLPELPVNRDEIQALYLEEAVQPTTRRKWFVLLGSMVLPTAVAHAKLGDDEWMKRFRDFVKSFNAFVTALNDGSFDVSRWQRMRIDWKRLDAE